MTPPVDVAHERAYDVHGIEISVRCEQRTVLDTVDQRLRAFPRIAGGTAQPGVRIEFVLAGGETTSGDLVVRAPPGTGRPVYDTPHGQLFYFGESDVIYGELAGVRLHCAASDGLARIGARSLTGRELYLATHPLLTIAFMELLERRGRHSIHAGCLAHNGRGVLLAGPSGAGKSTLTVALAAAGLAFLADDVVFLDDGTEGVVRALGFSDTLGVTEASATRFPDLLPVLEDPPAEGFPKRLVRIEDALPHVAVLEACEPRVLVFPHVAAGQPSELTPLDPREAWLRLVPDVLLTQPDGTQSHLAALAALLAQVRTYELRSGADLDHAAQLVVDALAA